MSRDTQGDRKKPRASLTAQQREQLRRALDARKAQLLRAREELREQQTSGDAGVDLVDVAEAVIEDRDRAALDEHDRTELAEIEYALAKFDAGTYGVSERSGRPIPFERLLAIPWARYDSDEAKSAEHQSPR